MLLSPHLTSEDETSITEGGHLGHCGAAWGFPFTSDRWMAFRRSMWRGPQRWQCTHCFLPPAGCHSTRHKHTTWIFPTFVLIVEGDWQITFYQPVNAAVMSSGLYILCVCVCVCVCCSVCFFLLMFVNKFHSFIWRSAYLDLFHSGMRCLCTTVVSVSCFSFWINIYT